MIPALSQDAPVLCTDSIPTVGVMTREYGTGHSGPGDADENRCEESSGRTCTVLMGYAEGSTARSTPRRICALATGWGDRGGLRVIGHYVLLVG